MLFPFVKKLIALLFLLSLADALQAPKILAQSEKGNLQKNGSVQGRILSTSNEPLSGISVGLEGTAAGDATNETGAFSIRNVAAGTYTLTATGVGYSAKKLNVNVSAGKTIRLTLQLDQTTQTLQEVVVTGVAGEGYQQPEVTSLATRQDVPLLQIPQAIQVIPRQLWQDQAALNVNEVSRNMVGVANNLPYNSFSMRGFTNYYPGTFMLTNGMRGNLYHYSQKVLLYNIEQMEVLRGPASVLYSVGNPGGVINLTTKQPLDKARYELNLTTGSWDLLTGFADATGPLTKNKKLTYRLVIGGETSKSFRTFQYMKNLLVNPTLRYDFSAKTSLTVDFTHLIMDTRFAYDRGTFVKRKADGSYDFEGVDRSFTTQGEASSGRDRNWSASLLFRHQFTNKLSVSVMSRYVNRDLYMREASGTGSLNDTQDSIPRYGDTWDFHNTWLSNTAFLTYNFSTGSFIKHSLMAGTDLIEEKWLKNLYINKVFPTLSILNPDFSQDGTLMNNPSVAIDYYDNNTYTITNTAGFIQDQIAIGEKIKLNLALRYNRYKYRQQPADTLDFTGTTVESDADAFIPRAGIVYNPAGNLAFYGSYTESFEPQDENNRGGGGPFPPKKGNQFEIGYKGDFLQKRLSTSLALYHIRYVNVLATDPADPQRIRQIVVPGLTSTGVEVSLQGTLTPNWSVVANYAYNQVKYSENSPLGSTDERPINTPSYMGNVWLSYRITQQGLKGLGAAAGITFQGDKLGGYSRQDAVPIPAFSYVDASVSYRFKNYSATVMVNNLLDEKYFLGAYGQSLLFPGTPRNVRLNIGFVF